MSTGYLVCIVACMADWSYMSHLSHFFCEFADARTQQNIYMPRIRSDNFSMTSMTYMTKPVFISVYNVILSRFACTGVCHV